MGVTNLDTLIIRLESQGGVSAAADVKHATDAVDKLKRSGTGGIGGIASGLLGAVRGAVGPMTAALGAVGAGGAVFGLGSLVTGAVDAAAEVESLTQTLTALTGSADIAKSKMAWISKFGLTSQAEVSDLRAAGAQLEATGLTLEQMLPTISNIASAFPNVSQNVMELAGAFGRVRSGVYGEMLESLRRFGITTEELMKKGIRFDGGGQAIAQWQDMLAAIQSIAEEKFGSIGKLMNNTFRVRFSNLKDAWTQLLEGIGATLLPLAGDIVRALTTAFNYVKDSGLVSSMFKDVMGVVLPKDPQKAMLTAIASMIEGINDMRQSSEEMGRTWAWIGKVFTFIGDVVKLAITGIMGMASAVAYFAGSFKAFSERLAAMLTPAGPGRTRRMKLSEEAMKYADKPYALPEWLRPSMFQNAQTKIAFDKRVAARVSAMVGAAGAVPGAGKPTPTGAAPAPAPPLAFTPTDWSQFASTSRETAANTRSMKDSLQDMRTEMFGGGDRSRRAVSHAEVQIALARALGMGIG